MLRFGTVEITGGFLLLAAWLNYSDVQGLLLPAALAAAVHELGHWMTILMLGGRVIRLRLSAVGAEMQVQGTMSYGRELACALAGPGANMLLVFWAGLRPGENGWLLSGLSLVLGCFNLLPVRRLDGGRVLYCILAWGLGPERAEELCAAVDKAVVSLLMVMGAVVLVRGGNLTLLLIAFWLAAAVGQSCPKKGLSRASGTGKMVCVKRRG